MIGKCNKIQVFLPLFFLSSQPGSAHFCLRYYYLFFPSFRRRKMSKSCQASLTLFSRLVFKDNHYFVEIVNLKMCIEHDKVFGTPGLLQMHRTNASNNMLVVCMYYQPTQWHSTFTSKFFILLQLTDRLFICCLMVTAIPMLPSTWSTFYVLAATDGLSLRHIDENQLKQVTSRQHFSTVQHSMFASPNNMSVVTTSQSHSVLCPNSRVIVILLSAYNVNGHTFTYIIPILTATYIN